MNYFDIENKTKFNIPIDEWITLIQEDLDKIDEKEYPIKLIIEKSSYDDNKQRWEYSHFVPVENTIRIRVVPKTTLRQVKWSFMHEFRHFMQMHIETLRNATHEDVDGNVLKDFLSRFVNIDDKEFYEVFHDLLPAESDAIIYATMKAGKNFRKHKLDGMINKHIDKKEKISK